jgi:hypothetical protein
MQQLAKVTAPAGPQLEEHFKAVQSLPDGRYEVFAKTLMMCFEDKKISPENMTFIALCMAEHFGSRQPAMDMLMAAYEARHVPALAGLHLLREQMEEQGSESFLLR